MLIVIVMWLASGFLDHGILYKDCWHIDFYTRRVS